MSNTIYGMKIFSPDQIKKLDEHTIKETPISSIELMEKAAYAFTEEFVKNFTNQQHVNILCGTGNNGGDGLVIARLLKRLDYKVYVFVLKIGQTISPDFAEELTKTSQEMEVNSIITAENIPSFQTNEIIIDAILGSGLNRPIGNFASEVINKMNASGCQIVSVDIASGLFADLPSIGHSIVQPSRTFTFQLPKLAFFLPQNQQYVGELKILDIELNEKYITKEHSDFHFLQKENICSLIKNRAKFSHKGTYGHVLLFAGSRGKMGAAMLSAKAALRTGCGLISILTEEKELVVLQIGFWEGMCLPYKESDFTPRIPTNTEYTFGIGPGIGQNEQAIRFFQHLLTLSKKAIIIDADGLNILASHPDLLKKIPAKSILTPHPKEFQRLVGNWENDFERLEKQRQFSKQNNVYIVLKGANSSISTPEGMIYFNSTGNPGMATAGSGDVLTGIITSLLAQNYTPEEAAIIGTYTHGYAGDLAAYKKGQNGLIASDIIEYIPIAFKELQIHSLVK